MEDYRMQTLNYEYKTGFIASLDEVVGRNEINKHNHSFKMLKQDIFTLQVVLYYPKNHYLKQAFDEKLRLLMANGLINFWIKQHTDFENVNVKPAKKRPEKINIHQLLAGFQLWFVGLCVSLIIFIIEITIQVLRKRDSVVRP